MFYTFDALSEFTAAERGLVVATMRAIEEKTGCVRFRKVESSLKTLMESLQGGRWQWRCRLGLDHIQTRKRVRQNDQNIKRQNDLGAGPTLGGRVAPRLSFLATNPASTPGW